MGDEESKQDEAEAEQEHHTVQDIALVHEADRRMPPATLLFVWYATEAEDFHVPKGGSDAHAERIKLEEWLLE